MKKISVLIIIANLILLAGCEEKEKGPIVNKTVITPVIAAPTTGSSLVMTKPTSELLTTFTWSPVDYGIPLGVLYTIQIDKAGRNFKSPVDVISVNALTTTLKYSDFNAKLVALEANMEQVNSIALRIKASVPNSAAVAVYSDSIAMNITPYTAKDFIWMVGNHNGWNNGTAPVMNRNLPGLKYELYLDLLANQGFKILPTLGSWDGDFGDDPANPGKLIPSGDTDMKVPVAGFYRISVDMQKMTWSTAKTDWGVIGTATAGGWDSDQNMTYDAVTRIWTAILPLTAGVIKFRANDLWTINYGDSGADGKLDDGGADISVSVAGTYTIKVNFTATGNPQFYTYTLVKN